MLNNVFYDTGVSTQDIHNRLADHYGVPHVSVHDTIYRRMKAGEYNRIDITPDGLHPNDKGHGLVAGEITKFLERIMDDLIQDENLANDSNTDTADAGADTENDIQDESACSCVLPTPVTANAYEYAKRLTIREICPKLSGFRADTHEKMGHLDHFKNGWTGVHAGDSITFELEGSCIGIQYRKTISRPAVRAQAVLDGDVEHPVLLDGNFDEDWGDCLYIEPVLHHGEKKKHTLEITVLDDECAGTTPFYLMAVIAV